MGLFGDMFKDMAEAGSSLGKLRNKITDLVQLLGEYSYNNSRFSPELTKQKIICAFNESLELGEKCKPGEKVRLYFPNKTLNPTVPVALKAAEYWVDTVLEFKSPFTNSLAISLIDRAENDLAAKKSSTPNNLGNVLQNYIQAMNIVSENVECYCITNNQAKIEYKTAITTFGRIMGYNHFILERNNIGRYELYQVTKANSGKQLQTSRKVFNEDLAIQQYVQLLNSLMKEMVVNPAYLQIATSGL